MWLDGAFRAYGAAINALLGNATTLLSMVLSPADTTANRWCSITIFPRTSKQPYESVALHGYSGNRFGSLPHALRASLQLYGHQLRSGTSLGYYDFVLDPQGLLDTLPPFIQLPAPLFIGFISRGASTHFGKVTRPDGVMLQLGQRSLAFDIWLWLPSGTSYSPASPGMSVFALRYWRECNDLHFITSLLPQGLQMVIATADFIRHFPTLSAVGVSQNPQQGRCAAGQTEAVMTVAGVKLRNAQPGSSRRRVYG